MKILRRTLLFLLLILGLTSSFLITYMNKDYEENNRISTYLKLSSLSVNTEYVSKIYNKIVTGIKPIDIISSVEYRELVSELNEITKLFPLKAKWTYITASEIDEQENLKLIVLTIPFNYYDVTTYPGFKMNISDYDMFKKIIKEEHDIQISGIVYDKDYGIWTKTGSIKLYYQNKFIGVLAVDLEVEYLISSLLQQILLYVIINSVLFLLFINIVLNKKHN